MPVAAIKERSLLGRFHQSRVVRRLKVVWFLIFQSLFAGYIVADIRPCSHVEDSFKSESSSKCLLSIERFNQMAVAGQQVWLDCSTCRNKSGNVMWWYQKEPNGEAQFNSTKNSTVIINNIRDLDAGIYTCACENGSGDRKKIHLTVTAYLTVPEGSNATLFCYSSTRDVDWLFKRSTDAQTRNLYSNDVIYDSFKGRFKVPRTSRWNFSLEIERVQLNDSGIYVCDEDSGKLNRQHTVQLITSVRAVQGRQELLLPCWPSVEADVVWVVWSIEDYVALRTKQTIYLGGEIYENFRDRFSVGPSNFSTPLSNYTLTIKRAQTTDSGVYACIERHGFGDSHYIELIVVSNETDVTNRDTTTSHASDVSSPTTGIHSSELSTSTYVYMVFSFIVGGIFGSALTCIIIKRQRRQQNGYPLCNYTAVSH